MATKAELESRVAELERGNANLCALLDVVTDAASVGGVRVLTAWNQSGCAIAVAGAGITSEQGAAFAGVFWSAASLCVQLVNRGAEREGDDMSRPTAPSAARE